ncbi:MAG: hypothetical protein KAR57_01785 [Bacteroidales bacterium]|nr:hypothetical protein [Bacteroidales bacterium]
MDKKGNKIETNSCSEKLNWETPKLICLDKGKTEGGETHDVTKEATSYQVS